MTNTILSVSVIIPTMNRPAALNRTLDRFLSAEKIPDQIIVIDQSEDMARRAVNEEIVNAHGTLITAVYLILDTPSTTRARNLGLKSSRNEIIIFSDDDVDVNPDTLDHIFLEMEDDKTAMIAGIDENMNSRNSIFGFISGIKSYQYRHIGQVSLSVHGTYPPVIDGIVSTQWAMGYFFVIRKSLADKWKLHFDEVLTGYAFAEDLDFTFSYYKAAKENGLSCILSDRVKVKHLVSKEWRVTSYNSTLMYIINREYLSYKHFKSPLSRLATRWANANEFFRRVILKNRPLDVLKAQYYCDKYRKDIKHGNLHTELLQ